MRKAWDNARVCRELQTLVKSFLSGCGRYPRTIRRRGSVRSTNGWALSKWSVESDEQRTFVGGRRMRPLLASILSRRQCSGSQRFSERETFLRPATSLRAGEASRTSRRAMASRLPMPRTAAIASS